MAALVITGAFYTNIIKRLINGFKVEFEWKFAAEGVGVTGASDDVTTTLDFGALNSQVYYCITDIYQFSNDDANNAYVNLQTHSDRWVNLYMTGHANEQLILYEAEHLTRTSPYRDTLKNTIYLGQPRNTDAAAGQCIWAWPAHTDTKIYNLTILGYALKEPLPLSTIFRQAIF